MTALDVFALPAIPWKNGGGVTRTITASPPRSDFDSFDWRVSIAEVASSGDFSRFPGVDRNILLLDGAGMMLHGNDGRVIPLTTPFEPFSFQGEEAFRSQLLDGPSRDFNVMTRRGRACADVKIHRSAFRSDESDAAVFFCPRGAYCVEDGQPLLSGWALLAEHAEIAFVPQTPEAVMIAVEIKILENS
jgi:environmental stress-induced protein Ves